jgi:two-component system chemotaxis sensor kinase CheA
MSVRDDEFLKKLRATFRVEAGEHLQAITAGLLELEKAPAPAAQRKIVETVFRAAHSLKGAARAVDLSGIESLCQSLEEVFASWRRHESDPSSAAALDALHRTLDAITTTLSAPVAVPEGQPALAGPGQPARLPEAAMIAPPPPVPEQPAAAAETVRIAVAKLDAHLADAEEMLAVKLTAGQRARDFRELAHRLEKWRDEYAMVEPEVRTLRQAADRPGSRRTDASSSPALARLLDFLDSNLDSLKSIESRVAALTRTAEQDRQVIGRLVDDLLEDSKKLILLPFATLAASFPKLVRDLSRDQRKDAELKVYGENIEIDKRILEEMKDPLMHLLRNSVDHGIETPAERARLGKPSRALIKLEAWQVSANKVQLTVSDDGAGIDTGKVKASAIKHGLISAEDATRLSESEAQMLVFQPEVSTSPIITQLSGRGLGLAIAWEKANKLGGSVSVESRAGVGTVFRIVVPATRATFRGILVEAAGQRLVIPTVQVERVTRGRPGDIRTVEGRETLSFDGRAVSLVWLADALELPRVERQDTSAVAGLPVIVLGTGEHRVAFAVDEVLDEQEVLVKPLVRPLSRVRNVAAATVLGSGQVAPVLNVADLLKSARKVAGTAARAPVAAKPAQAKAVLVAEDSITSRLLIKNILESAGYRVKTAVDGMEALALLRTEPFDLLVSDLEMPRLNGFDLTARIRADRKMADLPVVLVTALETRDDRERGIDAGANAYLVKSSFDQSDLIEAVRRLI